MARLAGEGLSSGVAATSILIAVAANTLVKGAISLVVGGWSYARWVLAGFAVALLAGAIGLISQA